MAVEVTEEEGKMIEKEEKGLEDVKTKDGAPWRVYCAHALSTWGDNMWWFAGGCYMLELHKESLRLTATYGLVIAASVILFGASVGRWIDKTRRLTAAKTFLTIQNTAVSICALLLAGFIAYKDDIDEANLTLVTGAVSVGAIILASIARLASSGTNIIIQKDWIVVIAGDDTDLLAKMNSILRTIELTTYMLAPAAAGQLFTFFGFGWTGVFIAGWNIISVCLEYLLLALIYKKHPALAMKKIQLSEAESQEQALDNEEKGETNAFREAYEGWKTYMKHPVMKAGVGLACLFMTVLGFDNITYGYCLMQGVPHAALGVLVGISALVGVAGSLAYPILRRRVGIERTGLIGMFLLISCSTLAVISPFLPGSPMDLTYLTHGGSTNILDAMNSTDEAEVTTERNWTDPEFWVTYASVLVFLTGIILARFGLWIVDLTVNQLLQEKVAEDVRGVVNGVQDSLNNTLDLAKCILVILLPAQETFALLIFASFISINFGWFMYALYSRSQRGHLFHFCRLVSVILPDTPSQKRKEEQDQIQNKEETMKMVKDMEEKLYV
eukprot:GFUD01028398.1.p1 GENE.GFUD01028398.1~~GFUD01028398.1.p1  ORF type:complete len:555 (-),score=138.14 GFUD01028398.1:290-1954(-)